MNYLDKIKRIHSDWLMSNIKTDFYSGDSLIANGNRYLTEMFSSKTFIVNSKNNHFHNSDMVKYLSLNEYDNDYPYEKLLHTNKKVIVQIGLHPISESSLPLGDTKTLFFDKLLSNKDVVKKMQRKELILLLYQGWEAEDFTNQNKTVSIIDTYENHYEMFKDVLNQYNLPKSSIIVLNSNLYGKDIKKDYGINVIYDNILEVNSMFRGISKDDDRYTLDYDYSVDEYLENIKNGSKYICRLSRTKHLQRDWMLYSIFKNNWDTNSIIEHKFFKKNHILKDYGLHNNSIDFCKKIPELNYLVKFFENIDTKLVDRIKNSMPVVGSDYEKQTNFKPSTIHSNLPIPFDVYKKSIFSWVSTSLPDRPDTMFLNQSTFNPILYYHPILWFGYQNTTKYFKKCGYESYDWLFENEDKIDNFEFAHERFIYNLHTLNQVMSMSRDELYNKINDNKDTLVHNRNLLLECRSLERILTQIYEMIYETEI